MKTKRKLHAFLVLKKSESFLLVAEESARVAKDAYVKLFDVCFRRPRLWR